jgi:hypothetical protein
MAYITKAEIEQYTGLTIDAGLNSFIDTVIKASTKFIEKTSGRVFEAPTPDIATVRYYDGNGATKLYIDDIRELSELEVNGVALTINEDFYMYPLNAGAEGKPYEWIELIQPETRVSTNSRLDKSVPYIFDKGQRTVKVTGKFGYSATPPEDVKIAALKLCAGIIKENIGDNDLKEITQESIGEYSSSFVKVSEIAHALGVDELVSQYIRPDGRGVSTKGKSPTRSGFIKVS